MKAFIKNLILLKLKVLSKAYVYIYGIEVVAITGSAGKTSTKNIVSKLTEDKKKVYVPEEAYNTEFGVPLALFKEKVPTNPKNVVLWFKLIFKMFLKLFVKPSYKTIVLEYGADKPGDIRYLTRVAAPKIAFITTVLPTHLEGFGDIKEIAFEKKSLIWSLKKGGIGIINDDNQYLHGAFEGQNNILKISTKNKSADYYVSNIKTSLEGTSFNLTWKGEKYSLNTPIIGTHLIYSLVGGIAIALALGVDMKLITKKLLKIFPERGRMRVIKVKNNVTILDDSYNSSPESLKNALVFLGKQKARRIAVLGDMNELGESSASLHKDVSPYILEYADILITIGEKAAKGFTYELRKNNNHRVSFTEFRDPYAAGKYLSEIVENNDIILFKGSQNGVFAEEAIVPLLNSPKDAEKLLVRQNSFWKKKKSKFKRSLK